jgi:putative endonuclease
MKTDRQKLGRAGENLAVHYLQEKGYQIIARNLQIGHHEIDIICRDKNNLVIVEVKSMRSTAYGRAEVRVSKVKQRSLIRATYIYLDRHKKYIDLSVRFDVICIDLQKYPAGVAHYPGAFWQMR